MFLYVYVINRNYIYHSYIVTMVRKRPNVVLTSTAQELGLR